MSLWDRSFKDSLLLSGEVVVVRLVAWAESSQGEDPLWDIARQDSYRLRERVSSAVHEHMGPEFDVRSMSYSRGSLEVIVVIGTLYYAVSRYKSFVESVELMVAQLRNILASFFERRMPGPVSVQGSWSPGPALAQGTPGIFAGIGGEGPALVVWYLVLSHAAMLAVLLWLILRTFRP